MEKLYSNIVGMPIFEDGHIHPITSVKDVVMDTERGKIIAVIVDTNKRKVIAPMDIISMGDVLKIHHEAAIIDEDDIIRIKEIREQKTFLFKNTVETREGHYLGKVYDFAVDMSTLHLQKIFVAKGILGIFRYSSKIIPAKKILEILPNKIIVENGVGKAIEVEKNKVPNMAPVG
jgi:uncharacterized protein YrrD